MPFSLQEATSLYERIIRNEPDPGVQCSRLLQLYKELIYHLSDSSSIQFNTLFARTSFITSQYPIGPSWSQIFQVVRREVNNRVYTDTELLPVIKACIQYLLEIITYTSAAHRQGEFPGGPALPLISWRYGKRQFKKKFARVIATSWNKQLHQLTITDEEEESESLIMEYAVPGVNDLFAECLEQALDVIGLPLVLGLNGIECNTEGHYIPSYVVILPDLLLDVTAVARLSDVGGRLQMHHIIDLFLPSPSNEALVTGNVANYILDDLVRQPGKSYEDIFRETFKLYPIEYVRLDDEQVSQLYKNLRNHYVNIRRVMEDQFVRLGIDREACVIEPSYISPQYGIKGRLDLYYEQADQQKASIIELKSGRPFRPNTYGQSSDHFHQTLLYDLLLRSTLAGNYQRTNYILYSAEELETLRYAVSIESVQKEAIHHRNQLVVLYFMLMQQDRPGAEDIFLQIDPARLVGINGFVRTNVQKWYEAYQALTDVERKYIRWFAAYIKREQTLSRIGSDTGEGTGGLAGLWLDTAGQKDERYQLLSGLVLDRIDQELRQTLVHFKRTNETNPLANFRTGDIIVLYPERGDRTLNPSSFQLYKATIVDLNVERITVRLYNRQIHTGAMQEEIAWNIEPDVMDSSFKPLYQSIWKFMHTEARTRSMILGLVRPGYQTASEKYPLYAGLSPTQLKILREGLDASFLYLLWGPPGTGKTSMMLRAWSTYYFDRTAHRIVLLAYTNRAVDEICEALHASGPSMADHYIRIGSRFGTSPTFRHRLLDEVIQPLPTRAAIRTKLEETRIYVGTVASIAGKSELFDLLSFDVAIIDEASQLLEPTVIGLLPLFGKTILIGDHMQLPAVAVQSTEMSRVDDQESWAKEIGLINRSVSYFERMFRLYQGYGWTSHYGVLNEQGRMHEQIMAFVNRHMYHGLLQTAGLNDQHSTLSAVTKAPLNPLFAQRMIFVPSVFDEDEILLKTNRAEANYVVQLIALWRNKIKEEQLGWTIGVITPFRAQIAAILHEAHVRQVSMDGVTVDTVERYQGGARDIIIMSAAVNARNRLSRILSITEENIDRKLNVAITRARQQFILTGNELVLQSQPTYASLIDACHRLEMEEINNE